MTEIGECRRTSDGLDRRLTKVEGVCGRLDSFSDSLEKITGGLNHHVSELWSYVNGLNVTVSSHGGAIGNIQNVHLVKVHSNMDKLNSSLVHLAKEFHDFRELDFKGELWSTRDLTFKLVIGLRGREAKSGRSQKQIKERIQSLAAMRKTLANK